MQARSLALAIPTYNRADILEENLLAMRGVLERLQIAVHIHDDSSNDDTAALADRLQATTQIAITYRRNLPALGHDANVSQTLVAPDADHVWLLGDAICIDEAALESLCRRLCGQDFVFVNTRGGSAITSMDHMADAQLRHFLTDRTWDITNTGATVYSRRVVDWWRAQPGRKVYRNFPQLSVVLGFVASGLPATATWVGTPSARSSRKKQSYWLATAIDVWGRDWYEVIDAHRAAFDTGAVARVLKSHTMKTHILSAKHLLVLRAAGHFSPAAWQRLRLELPACSSAPAALLPLLAHLPLSLAAWLVARRPKWQRRFLPEPPARQRKPTQVR